MYRVTSLRINDLNDHFLCRLCNGYLVDATTIVECLHSFCRSCILNFLEKHNCCPICQTLLHKTKPHYAIRPDHVLQSLVYKMVPTLFSTEMERRRNFYSNKKPIDWPDSPEKRGDVTMDAYQLQEDHNISLELAYWVPKIEDNSSTEQKIFSSIYLLCPAAVSVSSIEKLIRIKFELDPHKNEVFLFLDVNDEQLDLNYNLSDLSYLYTGLGKSLPLRIFYTILSCKNKQEKRKARKPAKVGLSFKERSIKSSNLRKKFTTNAKFF